MKRIKSAMVLWILMMGLWTTAHASEIHQAAEGGDLAKIRALIEKDAGLVDAKDENGRTPLHWAARGVHFELMKYLVEKGAAVNAADSYSIRPLFSLVTRNHLQAAEFLMKSGADLKVQNSEGFTALHYACYQGFKDMAALLIANGASLDEKDQYGRTPLLTAIQGSSVIQFRQSRGLQDWMDTIIVLLDKGAPLSGDISRGFLELSEAVGGGSPEIVKLLLDRGAEFPTTGENAQRLLHEAARQGLGELTELMLDRGVDSKTLNRNDGTLLQSASIGGLTKVVRRMIAAGTDVNQKDKFGTAPLHGAAAGGFVETVRFLLDQGVDIDIRTAEGKTAFNIAQEKKFQDVADLLAARGADRSAVRFPVLEGAYLGQKPPGRTPEMFAPGIVSREGAVHGAPVFSPDGKEIYWFSWPGPKTTTLRVEDGRWTAPASAVNVGGNPTFSPDGQRIFSSLRSGGIGVSERAAAGWSKPKPFDSPVNRMNSGWDIWLTKSGTFYFSSNREGGRGGKDIYRAPLKDGRYSEFINLGDGVNSEADEWGECGGFVDAEERFLVFSSNRPGGYGSYDLYISFSRKDGTWTPAVNLGPRINDARNQMWPAVSPDGKYLFYCHGSVVYWVDAGIIEDLKPKELRN